MAPRESDLARRQRQDKEKADARKQRQVRLGHILENADEVLTTPPAERTSTRTRRTTSSNLESSTPAASSKKTAKRSTSKTKTATRSRAKKTT